jgi:hypothetical protein
MRLLPAQTRRETRKETLRALNRQTAPPSTDDSSPIRPAKPQAREADGATLNRALHPEAGSLVKLRTGPPTRCAAAEAPLPRAQTQPLDTNTERARQRGEE